ncbi:hypothetical protein LPB72_10520 [Hydrogenophaga crassostreae]|uniref:Type VI secretion protein n=1 Tax=Hydrogenophaga crassostreae TaxID=1763535 RepID=A0A162SYP2_9BURK|nr:type IV secretion system protein [Hydrogenophaga crassostreae]AOW13451.1 hypothetical protein LPB072_11900 [Hydrogenophaga crassostreae]OAD41741.1 hypothetical protein LPB72_10520 [Hydrogenophaga crassostreae]
MPCATISIPAALLTALGPNLDIKYLTLINNAEFMCQTRGYLIDDMLIGTYRELVAGQLGKALAYISTTIVTIWVIFQGFMLISGANRTPVVSLLFQTGKIVAIMTVVSLLAVNSPMVAEIVLGFQGLITAAIVGAGTDIYQIVDMNLAVAQVFNALIDSLPGGQQVGADGNSLTRIAALVGQSGPAVLVSIMAIMAEISITLAIMLAPLFIFFLMFKQTSGMFVTWAKFLLGTMVSLAMLTLLSSILLDMMMRYGAMIIAAFYANGMLAGTGIGFDIGGSAMQLAALGSLSTALLMMIPPLIMQFFNSGASFAAGAMMGMMGGGAAGAGVMGVMGSMSGQNGQNGQGALGTSGNGGVAPNLGYNGGPGGMTGSNNAMLLNKANSGSNVIAGSDSKMGPGRMGLNADSGAHAKVASINDSQSANNDFRGGGTGSNVNNNANNNSNAAAGTGLPKYANGTDVEDAKFRENRNWGTGGSLPVDGSQSVGGTAVAKESNAVKSAEGNADAKSMHGGGGSGVGAMSSTNVHAIPPGQAGIANTAGAQYAELRYGSRTVEHANANKGTA